MSENILPKLRWSWGIDLCQSNVFWRDVGSIAQEVFGIDWAKRLCGDTVAICNTDDDFFADNKNTATTNHENRMRFEKA